MSLGSTLTSTIAGAAAPGSREANWTWLAGLLTLAADPALLKARLDELRQAEADAEGAIARLGLAGDVAKLHAEALAARSAAETAIADGKAEVARLKQDAKDAAARRQKALDEVAARQSQADIDHKARLKTVEEREAQVARDELRLANGLEAATERETEAAEAKTHYEAMLGRLKAATKG